MKHLFFVCCLMGSSFCWSQTNSIQRFRIDSDKLPMVCNGKQGHHGHFIPPVATSRNQLLNPAVFDVDYDIAMPPSAIVAFDRAVQILSEVLSSTIPIKVAVNWEDADANNLGSAGPAEYVKDFPNGPQGIAFPIALAEKIAQQPINSEEEADILVDLNRNVEWFYDFEHPTAISDTQFDFVSVALHELLHGLGFLGFAYSDARRGFIKSDCETEICGPSIFDVYLHHSLYGNVCQELDDPSRALRNALTEDDLFLLTPSFEEASPPQLYTPRSFGSGVSIYHVDQTIYERTPNSLMTPFIGTGEVEHGLGIALDILYDLGWGPESPSYDEILSPFLTHTPISSIDDKTSAIPVEVIAKNELSNVENVFLEFRINNIPQSTTPLYPISDDPLMEDIYTGLMALTTTLSENDLLEYRIIAENDSEPAKKRSHPEEGYHTIAIEKTDAPRVTYINDFNIPSNDFHGNGFSISTPSEFQEAAIHSLHPYPNAEGSGSSNLIYQLNTPIIIRETDPFIEFDEIVLVEPGEPNTHYTENEFWDYVIVEGKKLGDHQWHPLLEGYDSRAFEDWFTTYSRDFQLDSYTHVVPELYKPRTIDMTETGHFQSGDIVFVRFRLYADASRFGWGWAIDNLRIQDSSVSVKDQFLSKNFQVFPNPITNENLTIHASFGQPVKNLELFLFDNLGRLLVQRPLPTTHGIIQEVVDMQHFPSGMYWITLGIEGTVLHGEKIIIE